ncbi:uncharacterized protein J3R85_001560 [Psidium guajava]|nr:uncharacterized protein J3R85_001560 [Psidium guajava]
MNARHHEGGPLYNKGIKPTLEEYMDTAVDSIGGLIGLLASYFLTTDNLTKEGLDYVSKIPSVMHSSAKILRFNDDFSTSSHELARGDNPKALECYMNETALQKRSRGNTLSIWCVRPGRS